MTHGLGLEPKQPQLFCLSLCITLKVGVESHKHHLWTLKELSQLWILCTSTDCTMEKYHHPSLDSVLLRHSSSQVSGVHKTVFYNFKLSRRPCRSRFVISWRDRAALIRNVKSSTLSNICTTTCDQFHASKFSTHIVDGLQLIHVLFTFRCRPLPTYFPYGSSHTDTHHTL